MKVWRLSNHRSLDGYGGMVTSGRWHTKGRPIVYFSSCSSTSLLEILVHLEVDWDQERPNYLLLEVDIPDDIQVDDVFESDLPLDWRERTTITQQKGDTWLASMKSALLRVPSSIIPETNLLFNPNHPDGNRIGLSRSSLYQIDQRLDWLPARGKANR